jgi:hypothetical protein
MQHEAESDGFVEQTILAALISFLFVTIGANKRRRDAGCSQALPDFRNSILE